MALAQQGVNYAVEARHRASLDQHGRLLDVVLSESLEKLVGREVEVVARIEKVFVGAYALANTHKAAQPRLGTHLGHLRVERSLGQGAVEYVREYQYLVAVGSHVV